MSFKITLNQVPAGYSISSVREGEVAELVTREFTSSEDGELFISRLEGFPSELIRVLPLEENIRPSNIDTLVAIIHRDKTATVYVNEVKIMGIVRYKKKGPIKKGDPVYEDDIADYKRLSLEGVEVPDDSGFLIVFSQGWRKGYFFDFEPLLPSKPQRQYSIEKTLAHYWTYVSYQHFFKISDEEWKELFEEQWFPFVTLSNSIKKKIISHVRSGWSVDELLPLIAEEVVGISDSLLERWTNSRFFIHHYDLLKRAIERYQEGDYVSAVAILYPRIEGIMRSCLLEKQHGKRISQAVLAELPSLFHEAPETGYSLLLPVKFRQYIENVFFADFEDNVANSVG